MTSLAPELRAALDRYRQPDAATEAARAEEERADLLRRFPVESWPGLRLENYALGSVEEPVPYCVMLEYRTPYLGSIKGGSARKHIIYRPNSGGWWLAGPLQALEPHEAWERLRREFAEAIAAAKEGRFDELARFELLKWGPALVTKTLAIYAPMHFVHIYSADHMRRFIGMLGGIPEPDAASWQLNRQLKSLVESVDPFASWHQEEVLQFLYRYLDPRSPDEEVIKIAPGENARLWPEFLADGVVRVGWEDIPDFRTFTSDEDIFTTLEAAYPDKGNSYLRKLVRQLMRFRDLPPGAKIIANKGTTEILAVGTVTADGYRYDVNLPEYRHVLGVDWDTSYAQKLEKPARGWVATFNNVTPEQWSAVVQGRDGSALAGPQPPAVPIPHDAERLIAALTRKGQAIVHGPPGTGKTRLALTVALILTGRRHAALGPPTRRSAAIRDMLGSGTSDGPMPQVVMTSFHPSLGYEDFVEGFKPIPTKHGGLSLARKDGIFLRICEAAKQEPARVFVLIVDEINRADLSRVLGELVTLLEMDKREVVTVQLPVSGRTFSVPRNIRVIGTMNTADRSVAHLDAAVRRRFGFVSAPPDPSVLEAVVGPLNLASLLIVLNQRISEHLSRDHQLGHAHFMIDDAPVESAETLAAAFYQDVIPQLEDYALGDPSLLVRLLGADLVPNGEIASHESEDLLLILAKEFEAGETVVGA